MLFACGNSTIDYSKYFAVLIPCQKREISPYDHDHYSFFFYDHVSLFFTSIFIYAIRAHRFPTLPSTTIDNNRSTFLPLTKTFHRMTRHSVLRRMHHVGVLHDDRVEDCDLSWRGYWRCCCCG